jgi:RNA polymerase sigma-70 factor (ECF subfamily)
MRDRPEDWIRILDRLRAGDRLAFLKINGLITGFLVKLRAYDFQDEWDDLRQEIVMSVVDNAEAGRLRDPKALLAYLRVITRNKVLDRVKRSVSHRERDALSLTLDESQDGLPGLGVLPADDRVTDLRAALQDLPHQQRQVIHGVYVEGKTYEAVSAESGIPLGTMKRRLRDGLAILRRRLQGAH